jgi:hypothetical protein
LPYKVLDLILMRNTPVELIVGQDDEFISAKVDMSRVPSDVREGKILGRFEKKNFWWIQDLETRIGAHLYQEDVKNPDIGLVAGAHARFRFIEYPKGLKAIDAELIQSTKPAPKKIPTRQLAFVLDVLDGNHIAVKYVEKDAAETVECAAKLYRGDLVYVKGLDKQLTLRNSTRGFFYQDARGIYRIGTQDGMEYMFHSRNTINRGRVTMDSVVDFEVSKGRSDYGYAINTVVLPEELLLRDKKGLIVTCFEDNAGGQIFNESEDLITEFARKAIQFKPDSQKHKVVYDLFPYKGQLFVFNVRLAPGT